MRIALFLLALFLFACVVFAELYIYQVKGPSFFEAPAVPRALWILELLFMLVAMGALGWALGWHLRDNSVNDFRQRIFDVEKEREVLITKYNQLVADRNQIATRLARAQRSFTHDFKDWSRDKEQLKTELATYKALADSAKQELTAWKKRAEAEEKEKESVLYSQAMLQSKLEKIESEREKLASELSKSFELPPKDDLKLIHGIGPSIEKKLNALGISSYRQISEFTPTMIEEVSKAIKFFPQRIEKDNWISQARVLEEERKRQIKNRPSPDAGGAALAV